MSYGVHGLFQYSEDFEMILAASPARHSVTLKSAIRAYQ